MKKYLLLSIFAFSIAHAKAKDAKADPRFSFEAATEAFKTAETPTLQELLENWVNIGQALAPHLGGKSEYFPDGKQTVPDQPGYFYALLLTKMNGTDAFGSPILSANFKGVAVETGKVYRDLNFPSKLTSTDYRFNAGDVNGCAHQVACRIIKSASMLLCEDTSIDKSCTNTGKVASYLGYIKLP